MQKTFGRKGPGTGTFKVLRKMVLLQVIGTGGGVVIAEPGDIVYGTLLLANQGYSNMVKADVLLNDKYYETVISIDGNLSAVNTSTTAQNLNQPMKNDAGSSPDPYQKVVAAPNVSLIVSRNQLPQPVIFTIGIVAGIALLLLAYKYYPTVFRYFRPKKNS